MKLKELYSSNKLTVSFEFFPTKTPEGDANFINRIPSFKSLAPAFCSVTYGAGGSTREKTIGLVKKLKNEWGIEAMCHLTCVGQSKDRIHEILRELKQNNIENIIALRGDPPANVPDWQPGPNELKHAQDLVKEAASYGCFSIAVAGFPETHPLAVSRESDLKYLKEKVDAGADAVITQLFYNNEDFYRYTDQLHALGVKVPVIPGILPIRSAAQVKRFTKLCGAKIPADLENKLTKVEQDDEAARQLGVEYASQQCKGLMDFGVKGLHFFILNEADAVDSILRNIGVRP